MVSLRDLMRVAQIGPADVPRGLKGVVVADTEVGDVRGTEGFYHYRQYSAIELAEQRPLEDVWRLMIDGALPATIAERAAFVAEVAPLRAICRRSSRGAAGDRGGERAARRSAHGAVAGRRRPGHARQHRHRSGPSGGPTRCSSCAVTPTLLCALHRLRRGGREPVEPRDDLGYAANYLWMLTGAEPQPQSRRAIEQYLISTIDHGFNASTFTGEGRRVAPAPTSARASPPRSAR